MKKLSLLALMAMFFLASCGSKAPKQEEQVCEKKECCKELTEEQKADLAAWNDWDNQTQETQIALVEKFKACFDKKMEGCKEGEKKCCKEGENKEACPEKTKKCEEFKAKWENWENITIDEKKALLDQAMECCKAKKECEKE